MSASNGVIRIARKGTKKFAFGEDGQPFEVEVVVAFQEWIGIDELFRQEEGEGVKQEDVGAILTADMPAYHEAAVQFVKKLSTTSVSDGRTWVPDINTAEALDFIARLKEEYDSLVVFFRPKPRVEPGSRDTSVVEHRFSEEPAS